MWEEISNTETEISPGPLQTIDVVVTKYGKPLLIKKWKNWNNVFTEELPSEDHEELSLWVQSWDWKAENQVCRYVARKTTNINTSFFNVDVSDTCLIAVEYNSHTYRLCTSSETVQFHEADFESIGVDEMYSKIRDYVQKKSPAIVVV